MKCDQAREQILTDYLDNELASARRVALETHVNACSACALFLEKAREVGDWPLAKKEGAPLSQDLIWNRVLKEIETQNIRVPEVSGWQLLRGWISQPRPALVSLAAAALVMFAVLDLQPWHQQPVIPVRQVPGDFEYLGYILDEFADPPQEESAAGYGTDLETYFL